MNMAAPIEIFYSYAPLSSGDEKLVKKLDKHLGALKLQEKVTTWGRRDVLPGADVEKEVAHHLCTARIILLFVSPDFMSSEHCQRVEVEQAMKRYEVGEVHVIPIILSSVIWEGTSFDKLQCLPRGGTITKPTRGSNVFYDIAQELRNLTEAVSKEDPDLHKALMKLFGPNVPSEQRNASQKIINMLRQLSLGQRKVNELKSVHNMLHKLESPLDSLTAILNVMREEPLDYQEIERSWQEVVPRVDELLSFASTQMQFIEEKDRPFVQENQITGPPWATELFSARKEFAASLDEKASWKVLVDLARTFLTECLNQLFYIDQRLLQEVTTLDYLAEQILRSTNYDEPGA